MTVIRSAGRLLLGLVAVLALAGCASLGFVAPEVALVNLEFIDLTLFETSGIFTVRISNENPEPLVVSGGVYGLYRGGIRGGKGLSDHRFEVPSLAIATDENELHVSNQAMATRLREIYESGVVDYRIKARIYLERSYGCNRVTVEHAGRFDLKGQES